MGALKIDCYCSEVQMEKVLKVVTNHINQHQDDEIPNIDDLVDDIRICIDFENYMNKIQIAAADILDWDWEPLYEDTAVLTSRLKTIVEAYNNDNVGLINQAKEIRKDRVLSFQL